MELRRLSPSRRFLAAFASAAIVAALGIAVWIGFARVQDGRDLVLHSREVIRSSDEVLQRITDAETGQRGYVITGDNAYLAPYLGAKADVALAAQRLRTLTAADAVDQHRLDTLDALVRRRFAILDRNIAIRRAAGFDSARRAIVAGGGHAIMSAARVILARVDSREDTLLAARRAAEQREVVLLLAIIVVGTLLTASIAVMLNRLFSAYAAAQENAARTLAAQNAQLRDQAEELEMQRVDLEQQATELEFQATQLQEQATELEAANESLEVAAGELQERSELADRLRVEAESANRAKSDFLAVMSHELRTPLNAISGYVELLQLGLRGPVTREQSRDLERIERNGRHLLALISDVLSFAKLEVGRVDLHLQAIAVPAFLATLEPLVAPQFGAGGLTYSVVPSCGEEGDAAVILADEERLRQIVLNLLTNAIKFTPAGGRATLRCACDREHVWIAVSDTGRGIPGEKLASIFEPFVQIDRHLNPDGQQGVGLGLAISRELARRMGAELAVESRLGEGSTFTLRFPRVPALVDGPSLVFPRSDLRDLVPPLADPEPLGFPETDAPESRPPAA